MENLISWHVELVVRPGQLDHFRALTREMMESTKREPGVLIYERFIDDANANVHIYERYTDSAAAVAHLHTFARLYGERFSGMVERTRFVVYGDPTPDLKQLLDGLGAIYLSRFDGFVAS